MERNPAKRQPPSVEDLLLPFERHAFSGPYREFVRIKRNNTFASIQQYPDHWERFQLFDRIWLREIEDLKKVLSASHTVVVSLFIRAYSRIRLVPGLAFAGCLTESADMLRGAVESIAQAHRILKDPDLAIVWLQKDRDKDSLRSYKEAFEKDKKVRLFKDVPALEHYWAEFSEWSHSNVKSIRSRIEQDEKSSEIMANFQFFEVDSARLIPAFDAMLDAIRHMEVIFFDGFKTRLDLDIELVGMRTSLG
jgi:hypothetical protein